MNWAQQAWNVGNLPECLTYLVNGGIEGRRERRQRQARGEYGMGIGPGEELEWGWDKRETISSGFLYLFFWYRKGRFLK